MLPRGPLSKTRAFFQGAFCLPRTCGLYRSTSLLFPGCSFQKRRRPWAWPCREAPGTGVGLGSLCSGQQGLWARTGLALNLWESEGFLSCHGTLPASFTVLSLSLSFSKKNSIASTNFPSKQKAAFHWPEGWASSGHSAAVAPGRLPVGEAARTFSPERSGHWHWDLETEPEPGMQIPSWVLNKNVTQVKNPFPAFSFLI